MHRFENGDGGQAGRSRLRSPCAARGAMKPEGTGDGQSQENRGTEHPQQRYAEQCVKNQSPGHQPPATNATPPHTSKTPAQRAPLICSCRMYFAPSVPTTLLSADAGITKLTGCQESN